MSCLVSDLHVVSHNLLSHQSKNDMLENLHKIHIFLTALCGDYFGGVAVPMD